MPKPRGPKKSNGEGTLTAVETPAAVVDAIAAEAVTADPKKSTRKPAIVKSTNLVPINLDDEIRRLAYLMSERRGFQPGYETDDWLAAEREVQQRYRQHSA